MENIDSTPIVETAPAPVNPSLPNGVSVAGASQPTPAPAPAAASAPPISTPTPPAATAPGEINWLRVGAGIVIVTALCYSIWYFRYKTRQYSESIKEQDKQIASNTADIDYILNPEY
jgi:hypothetical protein